MRVSHTLKSTVFRSVGPPVMGTGTNFIGSGPFYLESNDESSEVVLKAFEDYHQGKPAIDEVDVLYIDDTTTRMMNSKNGDIDLCFFSTSLERNSFDAGWSLLKDSAMSALPFDSASR